MLKYQYNISKHFMKIWLKWKHIKHIRQHSSCQTREILNWDMWDSFFSKVDFFRKYIFQLILKRTLPKWGKKLIVKRLFLMQLSWEMIMFLSWKLKEVAYKVIYKNTLSKPYTHTHTHIVHFNKRLFFLFPKPIDFS